MAGKSTKERVTNRIPSGGLAATRGNLTAWEILEAAIVDVLPALPAGAVTIAALAARLGVSHSRAAHVLREDGRLRQMHYRTDSGRRAVCYVGAE